MTEEFLWSQKYRPQKIDDLILPGHIKKSLLGFVEKGDLGNFLFHSKSGGTGKTTAAMAMAKELNMETMLINCSEERSIDVVRTKMSSYCSTKSLYGTRKLLILDEIDEFPHLSQSSLRSFTEKFSKTTSFVLTANEVSNIIQPLRSRCSVMEFFIPKEEISELAFEFFKRMKYILKEENVVYDKELLSKVITKYFPDFRRCINEIQNYSSTGELSSSILVSKNNYQETLGKLLEAIKSKKYNNVRKILAEEWGESEKVLYDELYKELAKVVTGDSLAELVLVLAKYSYQSHFSKNPNINMLACVTEIMVLIEYKN